MEYNELFEVPFLHDKRTKKCLISKENYLNRKDGQIIASKIKIKKY